MGRKIANIYRREDGTYQLRFTVDGKRYAVYGKTVDEVRQKEAQKRQEIEERAYQRQKDITLGEYAGRWLKGKEGTVKDSSVYNYSKGVKRIPPELAGIRLRDLQPEHIKDCQRDLALRLEPSTVNATIRQIREIIWSAVNDRLITWNPARGIKLLRTPKKPREEDQHRALTREETDTFLTAAEVRRDAYRDVYRFMLHTGLRVGEVAAITDQDVIGSRLRVRATLTRGMDGGRVIGDSPKTDSGDRTVPLDDVALDAIRRAQELRRAWCWKTDRIFSSSRGNLLLAASVNNAIRTTCTRAGVEPFTSHAFRDTFATRCAESGMQPRVLMEIMGHSDIKVTFSYYVHAMDDVKDAELLAVNFGTKNGTKPTASA